MRAKKYGGNALSLEIGYMKKRATKLYESHVKLFSDYNKKNMQWNE